MNVPILSLKIISGEKHKKCQKIFSLLATLSFRKYSVRLKCAKIIIGWGFIPDPSGASYAPPVDFLVGW